MKKKIYGNPISFLSLNKHSQHSQSAPASQHQPVSQHQSAQPVSTASQHSQHSQPAPASQHSQPAPASTQYSEQITMAICKKCDGYRLYTNPHDTTEMLICNDCAPEPVKCTSAETKPTSSYFVVKTPLKP